MPELHIITGSNGAGKSAIGPIYLPSHIKDQCEVFDGDKLYMQKQKDLWTSGIRAIKEAKKIAMAFVEETFDNLVRHALQQKTSFVYEGHFTNDATWDIPKLFKQQGYQIHMIFLGLKSTDLSELRVIDRVKFGGHYVPRTDIESNFYGNLEKLDDHFTMFDSLQIFDTSEANHILLAHLHQNKLIYKLNREQLPYWFPKYLPKLNQLR